MGVCQGEGRMVVMVKEGWLSRGKMDGCQGKGRMVVRVKEGWLSG